MLTQFCRSAATCIVFAFDMNAISNSIRCNPDKKVAADLAQKNFAETSCSLHYKEKYHSPVPLYVFVILNFGIVLSLCFICANGVKSRIERLDRITRTDDAELQPLSEERSQPKQENEPKPCIPVFYVYIFHFLFGRALTMILFSVLVFYPADIPTELFCRLPPPS